MIELLDSLALPAADAPARVVALRGIPGSGKSTAALAALDFHPAGTTVRINNDDLAAAMLGTAHTSAPNPAVARLLARVRESLLTTALADPAVRLVIIDNTNLNLHTVHDLHLLAAQAGADFTVDDTFLSVPVTECITRDIVRGAKDGRSVGRNVITKMARQAERLTPYTTPARITALTAPVPVYDNDPSLPSTVLVDIDGTLALNTGGRGFFDWARVGEDTPNVPVVNLVRELIASGQHVTIMSGRDSACRTETSAWLEEHVGTGLPLYMRPEGDQRPDFLVKHELFDAHINGKHSVRMVLDDRNQVVTLWRQLGLPTWQVAPGDF